MAREGIKRQRPTGSANVHRNNLQTELEKSWREAWAAATSGDVEGGAAAAGGTLSALLYDPMLGLSGDMKN